MHALLPQWSPITTLSSMAVTPLGLLDQPPVFPLHSKFHSPTKHKGHKALGDILSKYYKMVVLCVWNYSSAEWYWKAGHHSSTLLQQVSSQ